MLFLQRTRNFRQRVNTAKEHFHNKNFVFLDYFHLFSFASPAI